MSFSDAKHLLYPVFLSLAIVGGIGLMQQFDPVSDAMASDPPYTQQASGLPGVQSPSDGPPFNTSGIRQRNAQIELLSEILQELRATRRLLEDGSARVTVDSVEIDYDRLMQAMDGGQDPTPAGASAPDDSVDAGSISATRAAGTGKGSGVVRRLHEGSVVSEQTSE